VFDAFMNTKPSQTLRFLETHEVFTLQEYLSTVDPEVGRQTRYNNLQNALRREQAARVARGLYASNLGVYRDAVPNALLVAAKAAPDAVISHHSALEAHGVAHSPFRTVYYTTNRRHAAFEFRGYRFLAVAAPAALRRRASNERFVQRVRAGRVLVSATSPERTLVDCLHRMEFGGGLEEFLRSVGGFLNVRSEEVAAYVRELGSPTLAARAGWLMSMMMEEWRPDPRALSDLRALLGRGTYWLERRRPGERWDFVSSWRLNVPADRPYAQWLAG
jgi:predicted transcriptional regulator of viral defense system